MDYVRERSDEALAQSLSLTVLALSKNVAILTRRVEDLTEERTKEVLTASEAAALLGFRSTSAFEQTARKERIPKHYISERHPRYLRSELYEFVKHR